MAEAAQTAAGTKPKITLHWLNLSRAQRIVWLLEECKDCTYDIDVYKRGKDMLAPAELKNVHPLGKSPVVTIKTDPEKKPEDKGLVLAETGALTEYLCDYFARHLVPKRYQESKEGQIGGETEQWLRFRFYMHYNEASLFTLLLIAMLFDQVKNAPQPFFIKPVTRSITERIYNAFLRANFKTHFSFLEEQLKTSPEGGPYLCGKDLTAADILMSFPLVAAKARVDKATYPTLAKYTETLENHPGYVRGVKKIEEITKEPYKALL